MKKVCAVILCMLVMVGLTSCAGSAPSYYGKWSVSEKLTDAPMGDYSDDDLPIIKNAILSFSKESASCFGDQMSSLSETVSNPDYKTQNMSKEDFESMMGETFDAVGRKGDSITQITVINSPDSNTGIVFYIVDKDVLLANSVGTFFLLKRQA